MTEKKTFEKGSVIFAENTLELSMYDIVSGKVGIYSHYGEENEAKLTELGEGKYFGEMGIIDSMPRSATAIALEDTTVTVIGKDDFDDYLNNNPDKIIDIFQNLCNRLRELSAEFADACATVTEYVDAENAKTTKSQKLLRKIRRLIAFNAEYADMINQTLADGAVAYRFNYYTFY